MTANTIILHGPTGTDVTRLPQGFDDSADGRQALRTWLRQWGRTLLHVDREAGVAYSGVALPGAQALALDPSTKAGDIPRLRAYLRTQGQAIGALDLGASTATAIAPTPTHLRARDAIAERLRCEPHDVMVAVAEDAGGRPVHVCIERWPRPSRDNEGVKALFLELSQDLIGPGATSYVHANGIVEMHWGVPHALPNRADLPLDAMSDPTSEWGELILGPDGYKNRVTVDLASTPHALVVGRTGSGKSIAVQGIVADFLIGGTASGYGADLVVVDPVKMALDFRMFKPYATGWAAARKGWQAAQDALEWAYSEVDRRAEILDKHGAEKWTKLSAETLRAEDIRPMLVVADELTSFVKPVAVPKTLPRDHPLRVEAETTNVAKEVCLMRMGQIAREARFVGINIVLATQRFGSQEIGEAAGELRENLGVRILLGKSSMQGIQMATQDHEEAKEAYALAHGSEVEEGGESSGAQAGKRPGRGIVEADGMPTTAFQSGYASPEQIVAALERAGVPHTDVRDFTAEVPTTTAFPTD